LSDTELAVTGRPRERQPVLVAANVRRNEIDGYRYLTALLVALPRATSVHDCEALQLWRIQLGA
jgi:hypothetical protein